MNNLTPDTSLSLLKAAEGKLHDVQKTSQSSSLKDIKAIEQVAEDFEALFISEMMKPMFEGVKPDPLFGGGKGEEVFQGLLQQEYGKLMAQTGQLGIADVIKQELIRIQESEADLNPQNTKQNTKIEGGSNHDA